MGSRDSYTARLANGLQVIGESSGSNKSAAFGFFVKTGARDESEKESGVSHFLEHMVFKGTPSRSGFDITYALGNIGAQANAYTSEETTVFYAAVMPEYLPSLIDVLSDMMHPALDPKEYDLEKKVILEEIALYLDRPHYYLFERAMADFFGTHPAGNSVLGSVESITALSREQMVDYHRRRYHPGNITAVVTGRFDWQEVLSEVERFSGQWPEGEAKRAVTPHKASACQKVYYKKEITQAHLLYIADGPSAQAEERYPLEVLSFIVGDATGSKLYWELIDSGLAESAGCDVDERDGTGCFSIYVSMKPSNLERVRGVIDERILNALAEFSDDDLQRAKTKFASKLVLSGELPMARLNAVGNSWTYRGELQSLDQVIERVTSIRRKDIEKALQEFPLQAWGRFELQPV